MDTLLAFLIGLGVLLLIGKILSLSTKLIIKLIINAVIGGVVLLIFNFFAGDSILALEITPINALAVGFFGALGIVGLLILKLV